MKKTVYLLAALLAVQATRLPAQEPNAKPEPTGPGHDASPAGPGQPDNPNGPNRPPGQRPPRGEGFYPGEGNGRPDGPVGPARRLPPPNEDPFPEEGRPDGERGPGMRQPGFPNVPMRPQAYLGVVTRPAPPELAAQLKLPEGFGLVVNDVLEESPAQAAGVQPNDLLRMLDDQLLVNPAQLEALVRRAGKDKEITLTLLRGGEEKKVAVKIAEKLLPVRRPLLGFNEFQGDEREPGIFREGGGAGGREGFRQTGEFRRLPGGAGPMDRETRYVTDQARVVRRDDSGTYEIARTNRGRILTATARDGTVIWKGPVNSDQERKAMPADVLRKFNEMEAERPLDRLNQPPREKGEQPPPRDGDDQPPVRPGPGETSGSGGK